MAQFNTPIGKVRITRRKSHLLTKVMVLLAVLFSTATLTVLLLGIVSTREQTEALKTEAAQLEHENSRLERYIQELGTIEGIIRIAQEELGLVEPGSVIMETD